MSAMTTRRAEPGPQTLPRIVDAEWRRVWRQGGLRVSTTIAAAVGLGSGAATLAIVAFLADGAAWAGLATLPAALGGAVAALWSAMAIALFFSRDATNGMLTQSMLLVPRRLRLLPARAASAVGVAVVSTATAAGPLAAASGLLRPDRGSWGGMVLAVAGAVVGGALLALFAFGLATVIGRPVVTTVVLMSVLIVLPLAVGLGTAVGVPALAQIFEVALGALPTSLLLQMVGSRIDDAASIWAAIGGAGGLLLWAVAAAVAATAVIMRRDR